MSVCSSVRMSVRTSGLGGNVISQAVIKIEVHFFVCRFVLHMSIYSVNIFSVGLPVWLQKAEM